MFFFKYFAGFFTLAGSILCATDAVYRFHDLEQPKSYSDSGLTEYSLFSEKEGQTWKMEIYDFSRIVGAGYHQLQNEWICVLEGRLIVRIDDSEVVLSPGQYGIVPAGCIHSLFAGEQGTRFLLVHIPGYNSPKDRFYDRPQPEAVRKTADAEIDFSFLTDRTIRLSEAVLESLNQFTPLDPKSYREKNEGNGFVSYSILPAEVADHRWKIDILEFTHPELKKIDLEGAAHLVVLNGTAQIEMGNETMQLFPGQIVQVPLKAELKLRPFESKVRVLCLTHF